MKFNFKEINNSKVIIRSANVLLVVLSFLTFGAFLMYQTTRFNLVSPLIPESVFIEIYNPIAKAGLVCSAGLLGILVLKIFKQHLAVLVLGLLLILINEILQFSL